MRWPLLAPRPRCSQAGPSGLAGSGLPSSISLAWGSEEDSPLTTCGPGQLPPLCWAGLLPWTLVGSVGCMLGQPA